tara:strand:- start:678 stop:989 length:312 start_codon:yes stop_codon:yes gene_type:complete
MSKQPYYPNNWRAFKDAPDETFETLTFDEFMDWKIAGWQIPSSVYCIVRDYNKRTGKIKEYVYQRPDHAEKKLNNLMLKGDSEITITTDNQVTILRPEEDYDD